MSHFTPVAAIEGGLLIGAAAALLWLANGRVAGISGIAGGLANAMRGDAGWRVAFLAGLLGAPLIYAALFGAPDGSIAAGPARLMAAGLLVGFGSRLGGGCTSGHGVCGVARLSARSIVATSVFIAAGMLTVFVTHHIAETAAP
jgi:uncharacterized membrane protein YedE/YeeE